MLRLVVALSPEARPLVRHLRLRRDPEARAFRVFRSRDADDSTPEVALVVSGPGRLAAATATMFLHGVTGRPREASWIDVGVAGSSSREPGDVILAHEIRDTATGRSVFPPLVVAPPCPTDRVLTVDDVERGFAEAGVYEMEAAGFAFAAGRLATAELVHAVKVVSDGPAERGAGAELLTPPRVEELVASAIPTVVGLAEALRPLAAEVRATVEDPAGYRDLVGRHRFTQAETDRLRRVLRRASARAPGEPLPPLDATSRGRDVLARLETWVATRPLVLEPSAVTGDGR